MTPVVSTARKLTKAQLVEIRWNESGETEVVPGGKTVTVQFNPATLRVSYSNQVQTNDQSDSSSTQYVGKGSSKMSLELIFDISMPMGEDGQTPPPTDVRKVTEEVAFFMTPKPDESSSEDRYIPPGVRFVWGTFMFEGIAESMDETLELWSEDGIPLRATVTMNLSQQGVVFGWNPSATPPPAGAVAQAAGTTPMQAARAGDTLQGMAASIGKADDWKQIASANGIENPRVLQPGQLVNVRIKFGS